MDSRWSLTFRALEVFKAQVFERWLPSAPYLLSGEDARVSEVCPNAPTPQSPASSPFSVVHKVLPALDCRSGQDL